MAHPPTEPATTRLLPPDLLVRLRSLQLRTRRVVDGVLTGLHRSPLHGASVEFAEHKEYAPGDEIRHLDWRVFGKSDKYYVKRYQNETNLQATLVLDSSASMRYRSPDAPASKWDYASSLAAALAYLVLRQQDAVGLLLVSEAQRLFVPPRAQNTHLQPICEAILSHPPGERAGTALARAAAELAERSGRRGLLFIISDFFERDTSYFAALAELERRGHHITLLQVLDPWEITFPFKDMTTFRSLETGHSLIAEPRLIGDSYRTEIQRFLAQIRTEATRAGMDHRLIQTTTPVDRALVDLFAGKA